MRSPAAPKRSSTARGHREICSTRRSRRRGKEGGDAVTDGIGRIIDMELRCSHAAEDMFRYGSTYADVRDAMRAEFRELAIDVVESRIKEAARRASSNGAGLESQGDTDPVTYRTLADIDPSPSAPLLLDMLEPDGPTLLYGAGGVGKGMTATWMMRELVKAGIRPLVYDAENRPKEWARRADGLGVDRSRIVYIQPYELPTKFRGKPFWDVAPHIARLAKNAACGVVVIDSVLAAMNVSEERLKSDAGAPYDYVEALDTVLELPSVSIGHTAKNQPEGEPYGSVAWVNAMRLTWLGVPAEGDGHRVRWRPRKRNERGKIDAVRLVFSYGEDGRPCAVERLDDERTTRGWIVDALFDGPLTIEELAENMVAEGDDFTESALARCKDMIRQTLYRMRRENKVHRTAKKKGSPWALGGWRDRRQ